MQQHDHCHNSWHHKRHIRNQELYCRNESLSGFTQKQKHKLPQYLHQADGLIAQGLPSPTCLSSNNPNVSRVRVTVCVCVPSAYWGITDVILLGPSPRLVPVCGVRGLLPGCSLIGSIQGLSSLMGLFAALLWTQTHLNSQQWQEGHQETHVPAWWRSHLSLSPPVSLFVFIWPNL